MAKEEKPKARKRAASTEIGGRSKSVKVIVSYEGERHLFRVFTADFATVKAALEEALNSLGK
ncbi:MAG: hypothetical protein V1755_15520 [Chloroflexota bacterium]